MSDYQILTVEQTAGGGLAIRRKNADDAVSPAAPPVIASAEGYPVVIGDAAEGRRFQSVRASFGPVQAGSGDPSPSNIRKLTPRSPTIRLCGQNLYTGEGDTPNTAYNSEGVIGPSTTGARITDHIPVAGESEILLLVWCGTSSTVFSVVRVGEYDANGTMMRGGALLYNQAVRTGFSVIPLTLDEGAATIRVSLYGAWNLGVYGVSETESFTLTAPEAAGDVYGGIWDPAAGTLTVDRAYRSFNGTEDWKKMGSGTAAYFRLQVGEFGSVVNDSGICSHFVPAVIGSSTTGSGQRVANSSASGIAAVFIRPDGVADTSETDFKAWLADQAAANKPVQIAYRMTDPTVYTVEKPDISAKSGVNTLFSDAWEYGADYDMAAEYIQDTGAAIEAANADTRAMIGEASGETASRSLAVGEYVTVGAALYRVTAAVGQGETLVPGGNVTETTVGEELTALYNLINA